jgi:hypothetical protein
MGNGVVAPHMDEIVDWLEFLFGVLLGKRTADPERSSLTYYTSIDAVYANNVPLGSLSITFHSMWKLPSKTPHFGTSVVIFS